VILYLFSQIIWPLIVQVSFSGLVLISSILSINMHDSIALSWPLDKIVLTQLFGDNPDYYSKNYGYPGHNGIDLAGAIDDPIHAAADGIVVDLGFDPKGYGNYIVLSHRLPGDRETPHPLTPSPVLTHREGETNVYSYSSIYGHMDKPSPIPKNNKVNTGDLIGLLGWTGNVWPAGPAGAHLHFGLRDLTRLSSTYKGWIDPIPFFIGLPARAQSTPIALATPVSSYVTIGSIVSLADGISYLNMRSAPSITDSIIYAVMYPPHPPFKVDEIYNSGQDIWLRTGIYWLAFKYNGFPYMQVLSGLDAH
jgi:murein DD-endopeptidase MepM/ murein hydrolase activator NlpD